MKKQRWDAGAIRIVEKPGKWPRLERPAKVGATRFGVGVSSRLVVEAAQREAEAVKADR